MGEFYLVAGKFLRVWFEKPKVRSPVRGGKLWIEGYPASYSALPLSDLPGRLVRSRPIQLQVVPPLRHPPARDSTRSKICESDDRNQIWDRWYPSGSATDSSGSSLPYP